MSKTQPSGWKGVCLVAITYVYFLIFAQFAFLKRLAILGIADQHLKAVMGAMAAGGILLSLVTPRVAWLPSPHTRLRLALAACGAAAVLSLLPLGIAASMAVSCLIGCGLGLLTVTLVTYLTLWIGGSNPLLKVGLGTGVGYLICNLHPFFTASSEVQAVVSGVLCVAAICITLNPDVRTPAEPATAGKPTVHFVRVLACFTALVWLDSAAFFIIQNTPALKAGTWEGTFHLWVNGFLHLAAALASARWLRRRTLSSLLSLAFFALSCACLLLLDPSFALLASAFYPVGVSLYSVALVAYPSLLAPASSAAQRGRQAGWLYAIAGWFGSAMGIGMGQNLGHVPPAFVLLAGAVILLPGITELFRRRRRELTAVIVVAAAASCIDRAMTAIHPGHSQLSPVERGRQVYISEGCINCHSQYVRPNTPDVVMWGPVQSIEELRKEQPPLIGNRRQGPDLAEVGSRRSKLWFKAHFYDPPEVSYASYMPGYAYLFRDRRGDDLITYLQTLQGGDVNRHLLAEQTWSPSTISSAHANASEGRRLFRDYCATCHSEAGPTRQRWKLMHLAESDSMNETMQMLARIVKFGIPGTDMPGHEYLCDQDITAISLWVVHGRQPEHAAR